MIHEELRGRNRRQNRARRRLAGSLAALLLAFLLIGARWWQRFQTAPASTLPVMTIARGVEYRDIPEGSALLSGIPSNACVLDVDLRVPGLKVGVAAEGLRRGTGKPLFADAHTVRVWCEKRNALAGINGGFFGETQGEQKQPMGLLVLNGNVRNAGSLIQSPAHADRHFARSVLGFTRMGSPRIAWVTSQADGTLRAHDRPMNPTRSLPWTAETAVACGPRLVAEGQRHITDKDERLVHPPAVHRTFVAYDVEGKGANARPRHLLLGVGLHMTFEDVATFVQNYFRGVHHTECWNAMCLDGGASSQMAYRQPGQTPAQYAEPHFSLVTVPTAILVEQTAQTP